jgi:4-amino-4-deoxy-L-arabinose transferase-like glycosyltransferase
MISPPLKKGQLPWETILRRLALSAIVLLAAALRFANLNSLGYANHYYTAAVVSMGKSWHNFLYVAAEPGGSVSVDKPPIGLWLQTLSAKILGVNSLGILLPQILAGVLSVLVLYHLVHRSFGTPAGLLAALALAVTPIVVATDRNNTTDSLLVLVLLLAAWAFMKATQTGRLQHLLLGAILVGVGFNIKMLEAYLPLPAFFALYLLGSAEGLGRKIGKLALAALLLVIVSFSWALFVDLTPADQRPYVGSSESNSELSLIFGYNGIDRLLNKIGRGDRADGPRPANTRVPGPNPGAAPPGKPGNSAGNNPNAFPGTGAPDGGFTGYLGQKGALRLITGPLYYGAAGCSRLGFSSAWRGFSTSITWLCWPHPWPPWRRSGWAGCGIHASGSPGRASCCCWRPAG